MKLPFTRSPRPTPQLTPQQRYDQAAKDVDYSSKACIKSYGPKTVMLTGEEGGEEKKGVLGPDNIGKAAEKGSPTPSDRTGLLATLCRPNVFQRNTKTYHDRDGSQPAMATVGITWVEPGRWNGRKAHFLRLRVEHYPTQSHNLYRVQLNLRLWKAGDAIRSIAHASHLPLSPDQDTRLPSLSAEAPEIALFGPRAVVGRPSESDVDCFWDGHFQPGDRWNYIAETRPPRMSPFYTRQAGEKTVYCTLCVLSQSDYDLKVPAPHFTIGLVVLSDGKSFELTAVTTSFHTGLDTVKQFLWSPYKPARFNGKVKLIPPGQKPIGVDFGSAEMKVRWKQLMEWNKPYDTISFGNKSGCADHLGTPTRSCASSRCRICPRRSPASTCKLCRPGPRSITPHEFVPDPEDIQHGG